MARVIIGATEDYDDAIRLIKAILKLIEEAKEQSDSDCDNVTDVGDLPPNA